MNIDVTIIRKVLDWLVADCKHRFDEGPNPGNYSPELTKAIKAQKELRTGNYSLITKEMREAVRALAYECGRKAGLVQAVKIIKETPP